MCGTYSCLVCEVWIYTPPFAVTELFISVLRSILKTNLWFTTKSITIRLTNCGILYKKYTDLWQIQACHMAIGNSCTPDTSLKMTNEVDNPLLYHHHHHHIASAIHHNQTTAAPCEEEDLCHTTSHHNSPNPNHLLPIGHHSNAPSLSQSSDTEDYLLSFHYLR